ncbi:isochorismatase family protein [Candidatus Poribacteria bacterium]|mgnify:CR=1 FL=1|nr:isochorismatase family protein [Candidatus Poribacteria bacterium]MBT5532718.1 isochorismatase family protein [Candidatus Poribacteria bacterium]MBT5712452.1 isochorismatase family protein [Candidatus Poribacteria bacterium]MBT7096300.1 isochorismatase family protein [Candidatus Poribacteria bacterium]MBT7808056.1 isochorismatase family protein [Candidatus Poribacteria bacterium]
MSASEPRQPTLRPLQEGALSLPLRSRVQAFKGVEQWQEITVEESFPYAETALLLCDVWDDHPCEGAVVRLEKMLPRMNEVVGVLRARGVLIVHAPSDTMDVYADTPHRLRAQAAPATDMPEPHDIPEPPLPVDSSDGGCDTGKSRPEHRWSSQHPAIEIAGHDAVSDKGDEVYRLFHQLGIRNMLIMGVHTNMCVLARTFAIRQMSRWGIRVALVRDLTDAMYNPAMSPYVSHEEGTELVVQHIEKYWCPTVLSAALLG